MTARTRHRSARLRLVGGLLVGLSVPLLVIVAVQMSDDPVVLLPGGLIVAGVALAAAIGGRIPAAVSGAAGIVALWWAVLPPRESFAVDDPVDTVGLVGFALAAGILTWLVSRLSESEAGARQNEIRYRSLLDAAASVVWTAGPTGRFEEPQEEWTRYTGQPWHAHRGFGWLQMVHPDDRADLEATLAEGAGRRRTMQVVVRLRAEHVGAWHHCDVRIVPLLDDDGQVSEWIGACTDVEAERAAERRAVESANLLDTLLGSAPVGFAFFDLDLRFVLLNELLAEINGLPADEHIGRRVTEVVPALAEDNERLLRRVIDTAQPVIGVELRGETQARPGVERHWLVNYYPVPDGVGQVLGVGATVVEVTERNQLLEAERLARIDAEAAGARARRVHTFTRAVTDAPDERSVLVELADVAAALVDDATVVVVDPRGEEIAVGSSDHAPALPTTVVSRLAAVEQVVAGVVASGRPASAAVGSGRVRALPVVAGSVVAVVVLHQTVEGPRHAPDDPSPGDGHPTLGDVAVDTAVEIAGQAILRRRLEVLERERIAQRRTEALRAQLEAEHALYEALQQAALPPRLPEVQGTALTAEYRPALEHVGIGGDWYDAFTLDDGRLGLCVADVSGHGVEAASVMAQLRNGLRAYALDGLDPPEVLTRLDALLARLETDLFASAVYAIYDPADGSFCWSNAGHPPPLVIGAPGGPEPAAELLDRADARGPVMGWTLGPQRVATVTLPEGAAVVLYTDGLVERRGEPIDVGIGRLVDVAVRRGVRDLPALIDDVRGPADDDLCVLVLSRSSAAATAPASPS